MLKMLDSSHPGKMIFALDVENVLRKSDKLKGKYVIFVLLTNGGNFSTLKTSVESVIFGEIY